ncbi:MAG: D-alanine--D-alanine ligase family protein [Acidimicrobiales bacterium]
MSETIAANESSSAPVRLVVLFGGRSAEHDVSCTSARHVLMAADPERYRIEAVAIGRDGAWMRDRATEDTIRSRAEDLPQQLVAQGEEIDPFELLGQPAASGEATVVFPVLHGPYGEDGTVQGLLELLDVAYVGSGVLGSALSMDKLKAKEMLSVHGIPQARWSGLHVSETDRAGHLASVIADLGLPLFVKPAKMGSSVGVSKATDAEDLSRAVEVAAQFDEWIIVEESISGREIECSVLGNLDLEVSVGGEVVSGADFYDYEDKYDDGAELIIPCELTETELAEMRELAQRSYKALRCAGLARVDFFLQSGGGGWLINEVNTMPGFTPISMYPKLWAASGLDYPGLVDRLVDLAVERHERRAKHRCVSR